MLVSLKKSSLKTYISPGEKKNIKKPPQQQQQQATSKQTNQTFKVENQDEA